jgi:hypothetical protein
MHERGMLRGSAIGAPRFVMPGATWRVAFKAATPFVADVRLLDCEAS